VSTDRIFLAAEWRYLVMLNYEVHPTLLEPFVPAGTELDFWNEKSFISLVAFCFLNTKLFGLVPVPFHVNFDEVNLRFYVKRQVGNEVRRGVVFISEIVPRRAIAFVARRFYNEKYIALPMAHEIQSNSSDNAPKVAFRWRMNNKWSGINLESLGNAELPGEGSVEQFITHHHWGYTAQPDGSTLEYRVTHPLWRVWQSQKAAFEGDATELYGQEFAAVLRAAPHSAFLAEGSAVRVMRGERL
jgi:uncharacterized protein YqjF (DUF2071 family)